LQKTLFCHSREGGLPAGEAGNPDPRVKPEDDIEEILYFAIQDNLKPLEEDLNSKKSRKKFCNSESTRT